ncbi:MAG: peptidoglycan D,D-transpeptidase FtsI family protein [Pseudomonadota bacterium]
MIRTPLRPLARILQARARGENPDAIERENRRLRHEAMKDRSRARSEVRLVVLAFLVALGFGAVAVRMGTLAAVKPTEPETAGGGAASIIAQRADIVDRRGRILATNLLTYALYAQPALMVDKKRSATELARIFPDLDPVKLEKDFSGGRKFLWIKKKISPEQLQLVHEIGDPGLLFGPREMRLYPNGAIAAHVLGGAGFGREGVNSAEVIGTAGVEKVFDDWLRDPANGGAPLELTIDLSVQSAVEEVLAGGMRLMNAKGAAAILMDVRTGEVISLASLPDFDPNTRPPSLTRGDPGDSPLFNRAVQGVYELGSTFKIFAISQALELGIVTPDTMIDTREPFAFGRFRITDFEYNGPENTVRNVIVKSSNVGTARIALMIGKERQQQFLKSLGFFEPTSIELVEAPGAKPILPKKWVDISTATISYGYGLSASPLHLAAAYATIANGGRRVMPTLLKTTAPREGERVMSEEVAATARSMLRGVVTEGTASLGDVRGYEVAGKTGTANKRAPNGGYDENKVITTFASMFPASDPKYVLVVSLDEPVETSGAEPRRTAGWTAVPVAAEIIRRAGPLLGLRPQVEPAPQDAVTLVAN